MLNQIIFTTTLKKEEGEKYVNDGALNNINFSSHTINKMLSQSYVARFKREADEMMVTIEN